MDSSTSKTDLFHQGNLAGSVSKDDATFGEDLSTGFLDDAAKDAVGNGRSSSNLLDVVRKFYMFFQLIPLTTP